MHLDPEVAALNYTQFIPNTPVQRPRNIYPISNQFKLYSITFDAEYTHSYIAHIKKYPSETL